MFLLIVAIESVSEHSSKEKPRIVFVYFMVKTYCEGGLPEYIQHTLNHTLATQQPQSEVVLVSNFRDCFNDTTIVGSLPLYRELATLGLVLTDSTEFTSDRTRRFHNLSREVFAWDNKNELWMTSALRFFILEDVMAAKGWQEALHVEADNLLYARIHTLVPALRQYPLAATPLAAAESLVTASVFWVSELRHLRSFTSFLLRLAEGKVDLEAAQAAAKANASIAAAPSAAPTRTAIAGEERAVSRSSHGLQRPPPRLPLTGAAKRAAAPPRGYPFADNVYVDYVAWLRPFACCKVGGVAADEHNLGLKPYAINEMSMLAFFRLHSQLRSADHKSLLLNLPVVPPHAAYPRRPTRRGFIDLSQFAPQGFSVGPRVAEGVWDPNSWGQFLGGTSRRQGRDRGFIDPAHVAGQAMLLKTCRVRMECDDWLHFQRSNRSHSAALRGGDVDADGPYAGLSTADACVTAPFVSCAGDATAPLRRTPLYNLHVHAKRTEDYRPRPCVCGSSLQPPGDR